MTINQKFFDLSLQRAIAVRRYSSGLVKRVMKLLNEADADLSKQIKLGANYRQVERDISHLGKLVNSELVNLASIEAQGEIDNAMRVLPSIALGLPAPETLQAVVNSQPFQGKLLSKWWRQLELADQDRIKSSLRLGMTLGESIDDMVRRVVGKRSAHFKDGAVGVTRRQTEALIRTAVNHTSNAARSQVWDANSELFQARIYVATLDNRTTTICAANDGLAAPTKPGAPLPDDLKPRKPAGLVPPAHINCRSVEIAYLGYHPQAGVRADQFGFVKSDVKYDDWLRSQSTEFQNEVLGKKRAIMFRKGLNMSQFVDRRGNELTLEQLAAKK